MISCVEIKCNAAHPDLPLAPLVSFVNSPSSVRILDVPRKIGEWAITDVYVQATYPDMTVKSKSCIRTGNVWVATLDGCAVPGKTEKGYQILADGKDEDGNPVTGYVLGVGDAIILERDGSITPGTETVLLHLVEDMENPRKGDAYIHDNSLSVYDGTQWNSTGTIVPYYLNKEWANTAYSAYSDMFGNPIITTYATKTEVPKTVSDLSDDVGIVHLGLNDTDRRVDMKYGVTTTSIGSTGIAISQEGSYATTYLSRGFGCVLDSNGRGTLQVGEKIYLQYENDTPVIRVDDDRVVLNNELYGVLNNYATMQYVDEQIGNVLQEAF